MTKKELKKLEIIEKGFSLMKVKGYNATGVNEIIHLAGIPKGSFYYYFSSKESFTIEILNYYADRLIEIVAETLADTKKPPLQRIVSLYQKQIENYSLNEGFSYGAFGTRICQEIGSEHEQVKEAVELVYNRLIEEHERCLEEARTKGGLNKDIDTNKLAEFIIYSWEGALMRLNGSQNHDPLITFDDMLKHVILNRA